MSYSNTWIEICSSRAKGLAVGVFATLGCGGLEELDTDAAATIPSPVQRAFEESCGTAGCHDAKSVAGGLSLAEGDSAAILDMVAEGYPMVERGNVQGSYLARKMLDSEGIEGDVMPARAPMPEDDVNLALILGWIAGAEVGGDSEDDTGSESGDGAQGDCFAPTPLPDSVNYAAHVHPIFEAKCSGSFCHIDMATASLELTDVGSDQDLIGIPSSLGTGAPLVEAGNPDGSYLWHRLVGTGASLGGVAARMPIGGAPSLCEDEMAVIYEWISGL